MNEPAAAPETNKDMETGPMVFRLDENDSEFQQEFAGFLQKKHRADTDVRQVVADILSRVRSEGDRALFELSKKFDRLDLDGSNLRIGRNEVERACDLTDGDVMSALELASDRIASHHSRQRPQDSSHVDGAGVELGIRWSPIEAVGVYVPGGLASYPSSVLMNAIPARAAGVERIAMVVPTPDNQINPAVLAAARIAGIDEIYRVGGAQAIGALAYGTETIDPVFKIVGPGNAYVAEAKRQVFGEVGIDMIAGPSEVLVIADETADISWIAVDLLAQSEHGAGARAVAMVPTRHMADAVEGEVLRQLDGMERSEIARQGWENLGGIIVVSDLERAVELANFMAPEHLELAVADPDALVPLVRNAGAVFLGHHTPEAIGDYVGGSNHVLPTSRTARFASGLGTIDFMKRTSLLRCTPKAIAAIGPAAITLARCENLQSHAGSVAMRLDE